MTSSHNFVEKSSQIYCEQFNSDERFLKFANESRNDFFLTDVTVKVGNVSIPAHRLVLSCYSRFFKSMFKINMQEKYQDNVEIRGYDGQLVKQLIDFVYTGRLSINDENVMGLLAAADYLQLDDAKRYCFEFLKKVDTDTDNCFVILSAAEIFGDNATKSNALNFIARNLNELLSTAAFKAFSKDYLTQLLGSLNKCGANPKFVYQSLLVWIKHDFERRSYFSDLFKLVSIDRLPTEFLDSVLLKEQLVQDNFESYKQVMETISMRLKGLSLEVVTKLVSIGGEKTGSKVLTVYTDRSDPTPPVEYPDLPVSLCAHAVLAYNDVIYCLGGCENAKSSNFSCRVFLLNLKENDLKWKELASMNCRRCDFDATVFQSHIVVAGAYDDGPKPTAEMYIMAANQWITLPSLNVCRSGSRLVVCKGALYSIGGDNSGTRLASVESLSKLDGKWKNVASMHSPRSFFAATQCNGFIYVLGGDIDQSGPSEKVEKYDPVANQWHMVRGMMNARVDHEACVMQGKIFVVGGGQNKKIVKEIECYDPNNDSWSIVATTQLQLHRFGLVSV